MNLQRAIVLVSSSADPQTFGTGFIIDQDANSSYVVTCAHVITAITNDKKCGQIQVGDQFAEIVAQGEANEIDLAVLKTPIILDRDILTLQTYVQERAAIRVAGQSVKEKKSALVAEYLQGELDKEIALTSSQFTVKGWQISFQEEDNVQPGYSGGPVMVNDTVVAVAAIQMEQGKKAIAISIEALPSIWPEMPAKLKVCCSQDSASDPLIKLLQPYCEQYPQAIARAWRYTFPQLLGKAPRLDGLAAVETLVKDIQGDIPGADPRKFVGNVLICLTEPPWNLPTDTLDSLNSWLDRHDANPSTLMAQLRDAVTQNRRHQQTCLAVLVSEQDSQYRIGAVLVENLETYVKTKKDYFWLSSQDVQDWPVIDPTSDEFSHTLKVFMEERYAYTCKDINTIHFFLPIALIGQDLDQRKLEPGRRTVPQLGKQYQVMVRFTERWEQTNGWLKIEAWHQKSQELQDQLDTQCIESAPLMIDLADEIEDIADEMIEHFAVMITDMVDEDAAEWLFEAIHDVGLPVALWQRDEVEPDNAWDSVWHNHCWQGIAPSIQRLRKDAKRKTPKHLGHHVGLLWDDHTTVPPQPSPLGMTTLKEQAT